MGKIIALLVLLQTVAFGAPLNKDALQKKGVERANAAASELSLSREDKAILQDEVTPYARFFLDDAQQMSASSLRAYFSFQAKHLRHIVDDGRSVSPVCAAIVAAEECDLCEEIKSQLIKFLPKRFQRRSLEFRLVQFNEEGQTPVGFKPSYQSMISRYQSQGCVHFLFIDVNKNAHEISAALQSSVTDSGLKQYEYQTNYIEKIPATEQEKNQMGVDILVSLLQRMFTHYGLEIEERSSTSSMASQKIIRLLGFENYGQYATFKKKILQTMPEVRDLIEVQMEPGSVDFLVLGDVSFKKISHGIVEAIGADLVIQKQELKSDDLIVVELK